jgi:hypothetical protein
MPSSWFGPYEIAVLGGLACVHPWRESSTAQTVPAATEFSPGVLSRVRRALLSAAPLEERRFLLAQLAGWRLSCPVLRGDRGPVAAGAQLSEQGE